MSSRWAYLFSLFFTLYVCINNFRRYNKHTGIVLRTPVDFSICVFLSLSMRVVIYTQQLAYT